MALCEDLPLVLGGAAANCTSTDIHTASYHLVGVDLQNLDRLREKLDMSGVQDYLPTLLLAECVLVYMREEEVHRLLSYFANKFHTALFINYEQVAFYRPLPIFSHFLN
ncbi:hypothetical protein PR048_009946 [Dryococelus australis]|uniref:[phosphatase 2A protein]-leucine-carboxy methyltransferase n=1 Tax=Dryococelus australis TaxID=614101 RepID=A0ABQ9I1R6_9NEOP|nr:hypothetical protein PR048_009946 [Dryococelus australis]